MQRLRQLIHEIHRRSLWQVLAAYAAVSYALLEALDLFIQRLAFPDWLFTAGLVLVLIGFPVLLTTAFLQKGLLQRRVQDAVPVGRPSSSDARSSHQSSLEGLVAARKLFTWRNAALGGMGALALWGALAAGWLILGNTEGSDGSASRALAFGVEIERAMERGEWIRAFALAGDLPGDVTDSTREGIWEAVSVQGTLASDPVGARVSWRPLNEPEVEWESLGVTPLQWSFPRAPAALRLEIQGYTPRIVVVDGRVVGSPYDAFAGTEWKLQRTDSPESDGLLVPGGLVSLVLRDLNLSHAPAVTVGDFVIDRHEVTNLQFQDFVDAGGYVERQFWEVPFDRAGQEVSWEEAMSAFVDRTGRPGPSTWEFGRFPEGTGQYPVTGVSWYEAMAYARFVGRSLPTLYHWYWAASPDFSASIVPFSNFQGDGPEPVGNRLGVTQVGALDMGGNAREWVLNASEGLRYTVGGGWDDPVYAFYLSQPQGPFDRSRTNGIRLITDLGEPAAMEAAARSIDPLTRDFASETPASDEVFTVFREMYRYDDLPLEAVIEAVDTLDFAIRERITLNASYGAERLILYLFLPADRADQLQGVVYFPGSGALTMEDFDAWFAGGFEISVPALVRSGRAVAFPIYKSTFERQDDFDYRLQDESNSYRDHVLQWRQDLGRSVDYLETRPDIEPESFSYFGFSWGGRMGPIMLAVEPRFRAGVLYVAGLSPLPTQPSVDPFNFAPRVGVPVLMLSGEFDQIYPLDAAARPLFQLLGAQEKKHYVAEGGHFVPGEDLIRETTSWLDQHIGPVRRVRP